MVSQDPRLDELILEVFEEHEDIFFWPVSNQKDAKTFVKFIHEKGTPYEDICKEIGEFEHNFSAWRKGLGRVGIGTRMIERINKTVESVIESDDEDNLEFNLKQLAKVNKKNEAKPKVSTENSQAAATPSKEAKQHNDIMNSMAKNIDKHVEQKQALHSQEPAQKEHLVQKPATHKEAVKKSEPLTNGSITTKAETTTKQEPVLKREEPKQKEKVTRREIIEEKHVKVEEKSPAKLSPVAAKRTSVPEKVEVTSEKAVEKTKQEVEKTPEVKQTHEDNEVDEVKKKMDAIRKKVEMMKKQKAEKQAHPPSEQKDGQAASSQSPQSPNPTADNGDKYEAMRKRIEELRNKIKTDEEQEEKADEQVPPKPKDVPLSPKVQSTPVEPVIPPIASEENDLVPEVDQNDTIEDEYQTDDIYDSDLDPDNYDSDLEYDSYKDVQNLANLIQKEKLRQKECDGPGHVFIYSDSPPDERKHRIKVGSTRAPDKKFRQAQSFNPSFKVVSCTAVSKRKAALCEVHKALNKYKLDTYVDWFSGPIDKILQQVSTVTEKYGSGPALSSFQTYSQC